MFVRRLSSLLALENISATLSNISSLSAEYLANTLSSALFIYTACACSSKTSKVGDKPLEFSQSTAILSKFSLISALQNACIVQIWQNGSSSISFLSLSRSSPRAEHASSKSPLCNLSLSSSAAAVL